MMELEELAKYWDNKWTEYTESKPNPFAVKLIDLYISKEKPKLLDLGCGDGRDVDYFIKNGFKVSTLDIATKSIAKIKEKFGNKVNASCQDIRSLKYENGSFDIIYAHLTLHYFTDEETTKIFNKIYDLLNEDGVFFVKCKSDKDKLYGEGKKIAEHTFFKGHVRHFFTLDYLKSKLDKFRIIELEEENNSKYNDYDSSFVYAIVKKQ